MLDGLTDEQSWVVICSTVRGHAYRGASEATEDTIRHVGAWVRDVLEEGPSHDDYEVVQAILGEECDVRVDAFGQMVLIDSAYGSDTRADEKLPAESA